MIAYLLSWQFNICDLVILVLTEHTVNPLIQNEVNNNNNTEWVISKLTYVLQSTALKERDKRNEKLKLIHDIEESNSEDESRLSDENKNIADCSTDSLSSLSHDQTDVDETTASYSSLEDEVIESNIIPLKNESLSDTEIILKSKMTRILDDNCNIPSSTTTSDSDSFPETKKVSDKLKSFLPYKKNYISMKNFLK
ncbi:hypothetical protein PGB90_009923 [Kerria lacca]